MNTKINGAPQDPFEQLNKAILSVASAPKGPKQMGAIRQALTLLGVFRQSFLMSSAQSARLVNILIDVTGGDIVELGVQIDRPDLFERMLIADSEGTPLHVVDETAQRVLVLPHHKLPLVATVHLKGLEPMKVTIQERRVDEPQSLPDADRADPS